MKEKLLRSSLLGLFLIPIIFTAQLGAQGLDRILIVSPPNPPPGLVRHAVALPEPNQAAGINVLSNVPAFDWSFGCSATSAAMISGYYDRTGYQYMYTGPTNGGIMPMDNSSWPDWIDSNNDTRHQCPLSATHNGLDGRTILGHVDDYWIYYLQPGPDPWLGNWTQQNYGDCTADYMKTNQWLSPPDNSDGSTTFWNFTDGSPLYDTDMEGYGIHVEDGGYGHKLFYESRGYTVTNMYNQYIEEQGLTYGFTYEQYKAEIDAGRPVMIHVEGHTMVGLGYDDATNLMYIHDTWDYNTYTMAWGGDYAGMQHYGVTIVQLGSEDIDLDFGDLDSEPTFYAEDGPRHATADLWLGTTYDLESDSRGYENDNPSDDGVFFLGSGPAGGPYSMPYDASDAEGAIEVTVGGNYTHAYVSAWFDQNNNSSFDDPLDNIVNDALVDVPGTYTFTFPMDPGAGGDAPFRIRVSATPLGTSGYIGYVYDGEVEDYLIVSSSETAPITFILDDSQFEEISDCLLKGTWDSEGNYDPGWSSGNQQMYDDGTNGDAVAGDHLWSLQLDLVVDAGAETWEWAAIDGEGSWLIETVYQQFSLPDNSPQTLTYVREGYSTPCSGVSWTLDDLVANSGGIVTGSYPNYVTQKTIVVCDTDELTIAAGTTLLFDMGELRVFGTLNVLGQPENMVTFSSNQSTPAPSDWFSIHFKYGDGSVEYANIEYAHDGVWCELGAQVQVIGCNINNVGFAGLFLRDLSTGLFGNNSISNSGSYGYYVNSVSSADIDSNIIFNSANDGVAMINSSPNFRYNLIYNNNDEGIDCSESSPNIINNTIDNNGLVPAPEGSNSAGIECGESSAPVIKNNIITNNAHHGINCFGESYPEITYNDVWGFTVSGYEGCTAGTGDISEDPLYVDVGSADYSLQGTSMCIDTGDPASPLDPDGTRTDMGAYYYDQGTPSENLVTFQADLTNFIAAGWFDSSDPADSIVVNGYFNDWNSHEKMTPDPGNANIYQYTVYITMIPGDSIEWKFRLFPAEKWNNSGWEFGDNRKTEFTGQDIVLDPVEPNVTPIQHFVWTETEDYYPIVLNSVTLDGLPIEIGDEVGVFFRDDNTDLVCGGGIIWDDTGLKAWEDDSQTPEKDGFESGEDLVYRLWDASAQEEYGFLSNITYTVGDGQWGTGTYAQVDLEFITSRILNIALSQGWNWLSSNVYPPDPDMDAVWSGVTDLEIAKGYDGFYIPGVINSIGDWDIKQMYTAYLTNPSTLEIEGAPADPQLSIELQQNWNWISYLPDNNIDAEPALASIVDYLNIAKAYDGFYIPGVINNIGDMVPGKGYKAHVTQVCTLTYPTGSRAQDGATVLAKTTEIESEDCPHFIDYQFTEDYQALVVQEIKGVGGEIESGDELGIYSESGLCIGGAVLTERYPQGLMAWMDDSRTDIIDGGEPGQRIEMRLWKASTEKEYKVLITVLDGSEYIGESTYAKVSLEVDFKSAVSSLPTSYALDQNYPNPFNPLTTIRYSIVDPGNVSLVIYDINGQLIKRLENGYKDTGYYQVVWDGSNEIGGKVSSGIYIYKMDAGQFTTVRKMVLLK